MQSASRYVFIQEFDWASNTKPVMYLFNQPWCGACNALKAGFQENSENIKELSESFVLVNVAGDDNNLFQVISLLHASKQRTGGAGCHSEV